LVKSLGKTPLIRVASGDISEAIYKKIASLYKANPQEEAKKGQDRPLLIILDRNNDLHSMLYHSWTYLTLI
jgi:hypothetical protein